MISIVILRVEEVQAKFCLIKDTLSLDTNQDYTVYASIHTHKHTCTHTYTESTNCISSKCSINYWGNSAVLYLITD